MFRRVFVEDWAHIIPFISFFIFATVFLFVTIRALCLGKDERTRLAAMPLEENAETSNPEIP